jgi:hypothetical protein
MSQYIGHNQCYDVLDRVLRAYEASGYTRLVTYGPGESLLMDSRPAPGYVPGVQGKKETGVEYTPNADGTRLHIYYVAGHKASTHQIAEAARANRSGFDSHEIMGTVVSIRRMSDGGIQLQFVAGNRDTIESGVITDKVALRSVSVTREPATKGGVIVAMSFDQSLGIPYHMLQAMLESEGSASNTPAQNATIISRRAREIARGQETQPQRAVPTPRVRRTVDNP